MEAMNCGRPAEAQGRYPDFVADFGEWLTVSDVTENGWLQVEPKDACLWLQCYDQGFLADRRHVEWLHQHLGQWLAAQDA